MRLTAGATLALFVLIGVPALCGLWWVMDESSTKAQTMEECPDDALIKQVKLAMIAARQQKGLACIEIQDPAGLAGAYCLEYKSIMPSGRRGF